MTMNVENIDPMCPMLAEAMVTRQQSYRRARARRNQEPTIIGPEFWLKSVPNTVDIVIYFS